MGLYRLRCYMVRAADRRARALKGDAMTPDRRREAKAARRRARKSARAVYEANREIARLWRGADAVIEIPATARPRGIQSWHVVAILAAAGAALAIARYFGG